MNNVLLMHENIQKQVEYASQTIKYLDMNVTKHLRLACIYSLEMPDGEQTVRWRSDWQLCAPN